MRRIKSVILIMACIVCQPLYAEGSIGPRKILNIGCHLNDTTCYVTVEGSAVGPTQCSNTSIRWNESSSPGGKNTLALLMGAHMSGKPVLFYILDTCYASSIYPTFSYINVFSQ